MKHLLLGLILTASISAFAQSTTESSSVFYKKQKFDREGVELYSSNTEMKNYKKIGLGLMVGSSTGMLGLNGEVNLDANEALVVGFGTGQSYGTYMVGWKHNFESQYLSPYTKVGYAKWFNSSGKSASDSDVLKRLFTEQELQEGRFDANFIVGGIGLEYNQLEGELAGVNFFGELIMMEEVAKSTFIPNGGVGIIYYY